MDDHAHLGDLLSAALFAIAGARLVSLSRRTGEAPESTFYSRWVESSTASSAAEKG